MFCQFVRKGKMEAVIKAVSVAESGGKKRLPTLFISLGGCKSVNAQACPQSNLAKLSPGRYRLDQDWIGTVEMAFCGEPSITRSL